MSCPPGTRLGPYHVTAAIGAGGMGEVYRARDTTLNRDVAIKVLPAALAADTERLARFKREAQVLASLSHSNIAHVYGFEAATLPDGSTAHFLAMELAEGEDLSERLKRGAIPVDEAIGIAKQIAEGLEEAHERGIIHRDLKPANIKLTPDGKVKILDFGLAKALEGESGASGANSQLSHSPTISRHMTEAGMIMGTAAYMSPEQARGKPVDKRADIWAFGVVLFEMLTGERLFAGETVSDTLAAVLKTDPDWKQLPGETPAALNTLLRRCLERDPRQRLRDIGDARIFLSDPGDAHEDRAPARVPTTSPASPARRAMPWLAGVALGALLMGSLDRTLLSTPP
ncbi:MAG TPA: serine/threonine-protein kinase, partial [Vicinamibacteria bacterium]|nr:serine/threonine-protein kinase [Vicinamibacteria bacterium]